MKNKDNVKKIKLVLSFAFAILVWQLVAMKINQNIILASPIDVAKRMGTLFSDVDFLSTAFFSFRRIISGFLTAVCLGTVLAVVAGKWEGIEILLKPFMSTVKAVPVASFVVLSLLWFGAENLSSFISFLMVLPIIYTNVLQGIKSLDKGMTQMAKVFRLSFVKRLKYLWIPAVRPYLLSGSAVASGLAWKSGIAAEIIGIPDGSVGEVLFESKVYLDTETLLAWTVLIVALSVGTEKLFSLTLEGIFALCFKSPFPEKSTFGEKIDEKEPITKNNAVILSGISKSFGNQKVLDNFSAEFSTGVTVLLGKSGSGKTTLLNVILGLEKQDEGTVIGVPEKISAVFQEDRLSNEFTPMGNVVAVTGKKISGSDILNVFEEMGINKSDALKKKIHKLSGGMKRRVALCRALCASGDLIVLDEPFKGLDDDTKDAVIETVKKYSVGKIVIMVTHDEEEAEKMGAEKILRI